MDFSEKSGRWWLPDEDHEVPGTLKYTDRGLILHLKGTPDGEQKSEIMTEENNVETIHGRTFDGRPITLINNMEIPAKTPGRGLLDPDYNHTKFSCEKAVIGELDQQEPISGDEEVFKRMRYYFPSLPSWFDQTDIQQSFDEGDIEDMEEYSITWGRT